MNSIERCRLGAVVIVFHPCLETVERLLQCLQGLWRVVIVKNDRPDVNEAWWRARCAGQPGWTVLQMADNAGIAGAINAGAHWLVREGAEGFWILDQDSQPRGKALEAMEQAFVRSAGASPGTAPVAAFVPRVHDLHSGSMLPYVVHSPTAGVQVRPWTQGLQVQAAIASGMLIPISAWKQIGPMHEALFMDHVDTEWCLRARHAGYRLVVCEDAVLDHELGEPFRAPWVRGALQVRVRRPARTYTMIKNAIQIAALPHVPTEWRHHARHQSLRIAAKALVLGPDRLGQLRAIVRALIDARTPLPPLCPPAPQSS